jgi:hypothetical protein
LEKAASDSEKNLSKTENTQDVVKSEDRSGEVSSATSSDNVENEIDKTVGENISMTDKKKEAEVEEVVKSEAELQLEKAMQKLADLEKGAKEKDEALEKASAKLEELEKAENARVEAGYANFTKSLSFIEEDSRDELVDTLMKARSLEGTAVFVSALEKAQAAINAFGDEAGVEGAEEEEVEKSSAVLDQMITDKYAEKKWL